MTVNWLDLPDDIWTGCFAYLTWTERINIERTCRQWKHVITTRETWPGFTKLDWLHLKDKLSCSCNDPKTACPDLVEIKRRLSKIETQLGAYSLSISLDQTGGHFASCFVAELNGNSMAGLAQKLKALDIVKLSDDQRRRISLKYLFNVKYINESFNGIDFNKIEVKPTVTIKEITDFDAPETSTPRKSSGPTTKKTDSFEEVCHHDVVLAVTGANDPRSRSTTPEYSGHITPQKESDAAQEPHATSSSEILPQCTAFTGKPSEKSTEKAPNTIRAIVALPQGHPVTNEVTLESFMTEIRVSVIETWNKIEQLAGLQHLFLNMFFTFLDVDRIGDLVRRIPTLRSIFVRMFAFEGFSDEKVCELLKWLPASMETVVFHVYGNGNHLRRVDFADIVANHPNLRHVYFINVKVTYPQIRDIIQHTLHNKLGVTLVDRTENGGPSQRVFLTPKTIVDSIRFDPNRYMIHLWHSVTRSPYFCTEQENEFKEMAAAGYTNITCQ